MSKRKTKGLVITGGGAWGAMGAGTLARMNKVYQHVRGISTGALMSPLVALRDWDTLKEAYTSVTQNNILDERPWYLPKTFKKNGSINVTNVIFSYLLGKKTAGTSKNLRKTIDKFISEENYESLKRRKVSLAVGSQNIQQNPSLLKYFDINDKHYDYEDFKDWMWASACAPLVMSLVEKQWYDEETDRWYNGTWTDGGLTQLIALDDLCHVGCQEIDIIIHREKIFDTLETSPVSDLFDNGERCWNGMRQDIEFEFLPEKIKQLNNKGVSIRLIWLPRKLSNNALIFDKHQMSSWYEEGYETAFDVERINEFLV